MNLLYDLDGHFSTEVLNITVETKISNNYDQSISFGQNKYKISYIPSTEVTIGLLIEYNKENIEWINNWFSESYTSRPNTKRTICVGDRAFHGCKILSYDNDYDYNYNGHRSQINIDLSADHFEIGTNFSGSYIAHKREIAINKILDE